MQIKLIEINKSWPEIEVALGGCKFQDSPHFGWLIIIYFPKFGHKGRIYFGGLLSTLWDN